MSFIIRALNSDDRSWVRQIMSEHWGAEFIISRGRKLYPAHLEGYCAENDAAERVGLLTYEITRDRCELVTFDALEQHCGMGTGLLDRLKLDLKDKGVRRLWLITTNDNLDAIRFYQRRGFVLKAVHTGAIAESRKLKPSIPFIGNFNIPIRDEIELEMML